MTDLVAILLSWAVLFTHAPTPATLPTVVRVPHAQLEAMACMRPCPALGLYAYGEVVYLDDRLDPETDLYARSILLHELVHYVEHQSGKYEGLTRCAAAVLAERSAYAAQNAYLLQHGALPRAGSTLHGTGCAAGPLHAVGPAPARRPYHEVPVAGFPTAHTTHVCTTGTLTLRRREADGDWHLRITDGPAFIVAEVIPALPIAAPPRGTRVRVCGIRRYDDAPGHGWWEVHPVETLRRVPRSPSRALAHARAPRRPVGHPPSPRHGPSHQATSPQRATIPQTAAITR